MVNYKKGDLIYDKVADSHGIVIEAQRTPVWPDTAAMTYYSFRYHKIIDLTSFQTWPYHISKIG